MSVNNYIDNESRINLNNSFQKASYKLSEIVL